MASSRLRCPGCKTPIEVIHETAPSIITCSQCGKRLRIGDKPSTGDAPASSPRPKTSRPVSPAQDPGEVLSEFSEFESTDESDESSEEQSWTDGYEDSWNDSEQEEWSSDEEEIARPLPPRTTTRSDSKRPGHARESASRKPATTSRSLDSLTEGTYARRSHLSEGGSALIRGLLIAAGILILVSVVAGFVRSQLRWSGLVSKEDTGIDGKLDGLMDTYDYYAGNSETGAESIQGASEADHIKSLISGVQLTPMDSATSRPPSGVSTSWTYLAGGQSPAWKLDVDAGPPFDDIAALSKQYSLIPENLSGQLAVLKLPPGNPDLLLLDVASRRGWKRQRVMPPESTTLGTASSRVEFINDDQSLSPDGTHFAQGILNRDQFKDQWWVTVHEFDNSLLRVFKDAYTATFVSTRRLLIASRDDNELRIRRKDRSLAQTLSFWNLGDADPEARISVALGGHWTLSPNRRYLVVVQPDEETSQAIEQAPDIPYEFQCRKVRLQVYETSSAKLIASSELEQQAVGELAVMSHDGTRLALVGAGKILIISMTDGNVVAAGHLISDTPEKFRRLHYPTRWLAGPDYFQLGEIVVTVKDGRVICDSTRKIRLPLDVRADRYGRNSFEGAYTELKTESLDQLHELLEPEGASSESSPKIASFIIKGTESTLAREFLQTLIPQRLKFKSVDNDTPDAWHVEVSYSEFPGVTNQNLDHWRHIDPWVRKRQQKEQQHLPESKKTIGVELTLTCSDATGQILFEDKVRGDMAPAELDFDMPLDHQFRASSLVAAISQLKALTATVTDAPHSVVPEDIFWSNEAPSENRDPFSGDFIFEEVAVDNSWLDGAHGIPIPARSVN